MKTKGHPYRELRTQTQQLIEHGAVTTTQAKAKKLQSFVTKLLNKTNSSDLTAKRSILSQLFDSAYASKFFAKAKNSKIKIYKLGFRAGDSAPMAKVILSAPAKKKANNVSKN